MIVLWAELLAWSQVDRFLSRFLLQSLRISPCYWEAVKSGDVQCFSSRLLHVGQKLKFVSHLTTTTSTTSPPQCAVSLETFFILIVEYTSNSSSVGSFFPQHIFLDTFGLLVSFLIDSLPAGLLGCNWNTQNTVPWRLTLDIFGLHENYWLVSTDRYGMGWYGSEYYFMLYQRRRFHASRTLIAYSVESQQKRLNHWTVLCDASIFTLTMQYHCLVDL